MKRREHQSGVTLMELLIAVTLVSLLSAAMLVAMRVGLNAMEKTNTMVASNRRAIGAQRVLQQQIAGFMPASVQCRPDPTTPPQRAAFFQGDAQSMRFVTSYSMNEAGRGYPRILEYQVIPGREGKGVRLVVNEIRYAGPNSAGANCIGLLPDPVSGAPLPMFRPIQTGPSSFVLADRLAFCRFAFRRALKQPPFEEWLPHWPLRTWPTGIRVDMAPLDPTESAISPTPLVTQLHVNKWLDITYAD